jgi:CRP-like cAMP-binding protein
MKEKKQIKNKNAAKILTEFVLTKYREMNEKQLQNEIFQMEKDEEELLIEEISKKITSHILIQSQKEKEKEKELKLPFRRNSILFDTNDPKSKKIRNIEAIYLTLLKFKGLKRYMSYQGLCSQDIRNFSCYIKHKFYEKGAYIVRQYDKSDALYGIINGCIEVRELETIEKTKDIFLSIANDNGEQDEEMEKIYKKIPYDYFLSDIESDVDNDNEENDNKDNKSDNENNKNNKIYENDENDDDDYLINLNKLKRRYKKKLKTVQYTNPLKQKFNLDFSNPENNFKNLLKKKRNSIIKKVAIEEHQTPIDKLEGQILEYFKLEFEEKRVTLKKGMCFGEWGIVYNIPRTTSIYCPVDTNIFYLEKKYFDKFLLKKFHLSDLKKIQFIYERLPILKKNKKNLEHILTKITPFFFDEGDIVYTPYDNANTLYLIYLGECYLCEMPIKTTNKIDYLQKKDKLVRVSTITEGGMVGLESCLPEKKYEHCLYVVQNFTILLKIDTEYFQNLFENFKESLINLYYKHKNIMEEFHIRNEKVRKELNFKYRVIKNKKKQFFEEFYKDKDVVNGKNDKDIIHRINSSRIIKISETRNIFKKKLKKYQNKNDENKKNLKLNLKYFPSDKNQNKKNVVETENVKIPKLLLKSPIKLENKLFMTNFNTINAKDSKKNINTKNKNISFNNNVNEYHDSREINSSKNINKKKIKLNFFRNKSIDTNKRLNSRNKFFNSPIKNQNFDSITNFSSTKTKSNMTSVNFKKKLSNFPKINSLNNASSYFNNSNVSNSTSYNKNNNNISHKRVTSFDSGLFNIPFVTSFLK